jgi:tRNA pseudouridine38-40 synthase
MLRRDPSDRLTRDNDSMSPIEPADPAAATHLRLDIAYDGTDFSGWAAQPGLRTVQGTLEGALETVLRLPPGSCRLTVAGRTDAGVHARGQVCSLSLPLADMEVETLHARLNRLLPTDVVVRRAVPASEDFNARFSATWRRYAYRICDRPNAVDPLRRREVLAWPRALDETAMHEAAAGLLGEHDFAAFCKRREGATTVRDLQELAWTRDGELLTCRVVANAFCHNMVRSLVGCLIVVGEGKRPPSWAADGLRVGVRDSRVPVVAASGLTLEEVGYPPELE